MAPVPRRPNLFDLISQFGRGLAAAETWLASDMLEEEIEGFATIPAYDPVLWDTPGYNGLGEKWHDLGVAGRAPLGYRLDDEGIVHFRGEIEREEVVFGDINPHDELVFQLAALSQHGPVPRIGFGPGMSSQLYSPRVVGQFQGLGVWEVGHVNFIKSDVMSGDPGLYLGCDMDFDAGYTDTALIGAKLRVSLSGLSVPLVSNFTI